MSAGRKSLRDGVSCLILQAIVDYLRQCQGESVSHMCVSAVLSVTYFSNQPIITKCAALDSQCPQVQCFQAPNAGSPLSAKLCTEANMWKFNNESVCQLSSLDGVFWYLSVCAFIYLQQHKGSLESSLLPMFRTAGFVYL